MYNFYNHKSLMLLVAMICTFSLSAQVQVTLELGDGTTFGPYQAFTASFGPELTACAGGFDGAAELYIEPNGSTLGCDTVSTTTTDVAGKIAIIDRGVCGFVVKVLNAQNAGATGVIIVSDNRDPGGMGGEDDRITIPSVLISMADGDQLKANIGAEDAVVSVGGATTEFDTRDIVLWGNEAGQGDFTDGLNGWTAVNYTECAADSIEGFTLFQWAPSGDAPDGAYGAGSITSPTNCGGAVSFQSDFFDNDGIQGNFGNGPCAANQAGALISPTIDISGSPDAAGIAVSFYQSARQFQSTYWVGWSIDDGATWDSLQINQDYETNAAASNEFERINLPNEVIGASNLRVKFVLDPANYYFWLIDDVRIVEREANNLALTDFFAIPPNAITPQSQIEPFGFLADIQNLGARNQASATLNVTIFGPSDDIVYTEDLLLDGGIGSDSLLENQVLGTTFTPEEIGLYRGVYTVSLDPELEDFNEDDNQQEFFFFVSETTFAKEYSLESGEALAAVSPGGDFTDWAYGNYFYVPNGDGYEVNTVSFGIGNVEEIAGLSVTVLIYKWEDLNENGVSEADERDPIGFIDYEITGEETNNQPITVDFTEEGVLLEDDTEYLVMLLANGPITISASGGVVDYLATLTLTDGQGDIRYSGFFGDNADIDGDFSPDVGFTPFVRMEINTVGVNTEEVLAQEHGMELFPNPTSSQVTLDLKLEEAAQQVDVRVYSITGQLMLQDRLQNIQAQQFNYNVENLANGVYLMEVTTDFGVRTLKFEVAR
jgi:hypothetical protein